MKILIYGYGNPGRQDDGLGYAVCQRIEAWAAEKHLPDISFDSNYQLNIEDADAIAEQDLVIFVDASTEEIQDYCFSRVDGSTKVSFTSHAASPGYIVQLCRQLFGKEPLVLLLHIKGYQWAFQEGLTKQAQDNLELAVEGLKKLLAEPEKMVTSLDALKMCG